MPLTPAEKQAAYRERKRQAQGTPDDLDAAREAYVAAQLEQTRLYAESFRASEKREPEALQERYQRAERYARWRWDAYLAGEVFSL